MKAESNGPQARRTAVACCAKSRGGPDAQAPSDTGTGQKKPLKSGGFGLCRQLTY
jgi:hypothetical protein